MKREAFIALWSMLAIQLVWILYNRTHGNAPLNEWVWPFVITSGAVAVTRGRIAWLGTFPRIIIALDFLLAVADRLGFFGGPGTPGVGWGDFAHFTAYTAKVNSFLPLGMIPSIAVIATIAETTLGITMLLGLYSRFAAAGSAVLLTMFATAMWISGLSHMLYAVYLMAAGAWVLATMEPSPLSVDALLARWSHRAREASPATGNSARQIQ